MITTRKEDISKWASRIDTVIAQIDQCCIDRAVVIESTKSTMDAVKEFAGERCGVLVVASEQTAGRGQRGRHWVDNDRRTLPCTFAIDAKSIEPVMLSAMIGCAVHETVQGLAPPSCSVMIKWPNDIVIRGQVGDGGDGSSQDRKVAGILIEQSGGCASVGVGINCLQGGDDWCDQAGQAAVSLSELGVQVSRLDLVCSLIEHMSHWISACDRSAIRSYYQAHDAMVNTYRVFQYNNHRYEGVVEHIDPLDSIFVQTPSGTHQLPIAQTQHLRQP